MTIQVNTEKPSYLLTCKRFFERVGTPVYRELARAKLPTRIDEMPDALVNPDFVYQFRHRCQAIEKIDDLGFHLYQHVQIDDIGCNVATTSRVCCSTVDVLKIAAVSSRAAIDPLEQVGCEQSSTPVTACDPSLAHSTRRVL